MLEQSLVSLAKKQSRVTAIFTIILLLTQLVIAYNHSGAELTFHLKGRASQCAFVNSKVPEDRLYIHYVSLSDLGEEYVDFSVQGPNDLILFQDERQQEHRILLRAHKTGMYTLCFRNEHSHVKFVTFIARLGAESGVQAIKQSLSAKTDPLLVGLTRIQQLVEDVRNAQSYIARRERAIRDIAEETNAQILWGSILQIGIIVAMSLLQLRILKNSFSTRRQV